MPYRDALAYLHGSSSTAGQPETSTLTTLTGVSQSGTTLTYTVATGQIIPGQMVQLAGGGYTTQNVEVVAILTGGGSSGTATVNVSQTVTTTTANVYPAIIGDVLCQAGSQYSNLELDFGAPNPGLSSPWLPAFPSLTEKGYTFPPEVVGQGGVEVGLHIIITSPFNTLTSVNFQVVTSATTAALFNGTPGAIASRSLTLAQMQAVGAHYFIPTQQSAILEFLRFYAALTGSNATLGTIVSWFGPRTGGEQ